jgi:hypothetical protein
LEKKEFEEGEMSEWLCPDTGGSRIEGEAGAEVADAISELVDYYVSFLKSLTLKLN